MGWHKRSKLLYETFRNVSSKLVTKNPIPNPPPTPMPRFNSSSYYSFYNQYKPSGLFGSPSISSKFGNLSGFKYNQNQSSFLSGATRRYYYVDRYQVYHFRPRGHRRWLRDPRIVLIVVVFGTGAAITIYYGNLEVVPYTKRKHFVLLSRNMERQIGETQFKRMKKAFQDKILPAMHPESIRVRLIARDIIEALQRGLSHEQVWSEPSYSWEADALFENAEHETLKALRKGVEETVLDKWEMDEGDLESLDDMWIKNSRKKAEKSGSKPATQHLEGLNWEVLVVDEPVVNAFCLPGGKIVVFTGLLKHFRTDPEIATVLGHEVGHAVARHSAEMLTKSMWLVLLELVLFQFITPDIVVAMSSLLLRLPFSRKMEMEADYIGLLLMASAGYDPRVAPKVYEKLGKVTGDSALRDYLSTHPSGKTRAQLLARAEVMEEALIVYQETIAGRGIEGFL